jgi:hypothetical protein
MKQEVSMLSEVKRTAMHRILFLPHALRQLLRPDRMISKFEVRQVIKEGEIIEDYPDDNRGHSCLMLGSGNERRPIHIVCAPKQDYLAIITAYIPMENEWENDFKTRKKL